MNLKRVFIFRVNELSRYRHAGTKGERMYSSSFLTELEGGEWSASFPGHFLPPGKNPGILLIVLYPNETLNKWTDKSFTYETT
jgi:hypothetical protein